MVNMIRFKLVILSVLGLSYLRAHAGILGPFRPICAVSLFDPDEAALNKYAAALAALTPLRRSCEVEVRRNLSPWACLVRTIRGANSL